MTDDRISVQLWSVRDALAADQTAALERIAGLGLRQVEPFGFDADGAAWAETLAAVALTAPSAHSHLLESPDPGAVFDAARSAGIGILVDPGVSPERWGDADFVAATADRMGELAALGTERGVRVGYHNHAFELRARIGGQSAFDYFLDRLDPAVELELDTYWLAVGGVSPAEMVDRLAGRVPAIHVKDGPLTDDDIDQLPAGEGAMDIPALLSAARDALWVIEFDDYRGDPFDGIAASLAYLRGR